MGWYFGGLQVPGNLRRAGVDTSRMSKQRRVGSRVIAFPVQRRAGALDAPLSPARARRAAARNAQLVAAQGLTPADLGIDAAPHTIAFCQEVARLQALYGLPVDGMVGPETAAALAASPETGDGE